MNDDQLFLANAYVDGELTDAERAIAEADPTVMAEVDELRALQAELRDVEPPTDTARESAIAAAMAEFTTTTAVAAPAPSSPPGEAAVAPVVPLHRRAWFRPTLSIAAAAVGVGLFAVIVTQVGGGDDDSFDSAEPAAEAVADEPADEPADESFGDFESSDADDAMRDGAGEPADEPADEPAAEPADEPAAAADAAEDDMAEEEMAEEPAEEPAEEAAEDAGDSAEPGSVPVDLTILSGGTPDNPIVVEDDLVTYAIGLIRNRDLGELEPSPNHACAEAINVIANGFVVDDGVVVEALIDLSPDETTVVAWSLDDATPPCTLLLTAVLPTPTG